ncbi:histidine phosphotransferase family protein [Magnetospira thiophila]
MPVLVDLKVTELVCSRLCHDLISPVGAVNSGIELLEEGDIALREEALGLVGRSGDMAARRLSFYRLAFGFAGSAEGTHSLTDIRKLAEGLLSDGKVELDWPGGEGSVSRGGARLMLNMIQLASDCLPSGGKVSVQFGFLEEGLGVAISARGNKARLRDDLKLAMSAEATLDDLTARNVQGYFAQRLAEELNVSLEVADDPDDEVRLAALLPA